MQTKIKEIIGIKYEQKVVWVGIFTIEISFFIFIKSTQDIVIHAYLARRQRSYNSWCGLISFLNIEWIEHQTNGTKLSLEPT